MSIDLQTVADRMAPQSFGMSHVIIAGGNEEVASDDLLDWTQPLLNGLDGGHWASLQLEFATDCEVFVRFRSGLNEVEINLYEFWSDVELAAILNIIPSTNQLLFLALDKYENQALSLLDGVASWLMLLDSTAQELTPVVRMFHELWRMIRNLQL